MNSFYRNPFVFTAEGAESAENNNSLLRALCVLCG